MNSRLYIIGVTLLAISSYSWAAPEPIVKVEGNVTITRSFHENGNLDRILRTKNGVLHGIAEVYDEETGKIKEKWTYENGIITRSQHIDENGNITREYTYKDEIDGSSKTSYRYYANGKLDRILRYENDILNGKTEVYDPDTSEISDIWIYKNGEIVEHIEK